MTKAGTKLPRQQSTGASRSVRWLPLASLVVAFSGLFTAGVLSAGHLLNLPVPCGGSHDCLSVALHPSSKIIGIPIAFFGVAAYVIIIFLLGRAKAARWARVSFVALAGLGTAISVALLIYAHSVIHATCAWCIASGAAMTTLFILSIVGLKRAPTMRPVRPALVWSLAFLTATAIGVQAGLMQKTANTPPIPAARLAGLSTTDLVDPAKSLGPTNAPVTIVVFADLWCPVCRDAHASLVNYQQSNSTGVRLAFRHLPLWEIRGHESSRVAAALSEMAGEKEKFWEFIDAVYAQPRQLKGADYLKLMGRLGLNPADAASRLSDPQRDPAVARVLHDESLAERFGINTTPTFILLVAGQQPISANQRTLPRLLNSPEVRSMLVQSLPRKPDSSELNR